MSEHRLALGRVSVPILEAEEGYEVEGWPRHADQPSLLDWLVLGDADAFTPHAEVVESFNGYRFGHGTGSFTWELMMSIEMIDWFRRQFFGKTDGAEGGYTALVTAMTEDSTFGDGWRPVVALMQYPTAKRMTREGTLWRIPLDFSDAVAAPTGCDLVINLDDDDADWIVDEDTDVICTVTNQGDYQTSSPTTVLIPIAEGLELAAVSASGWTVAYSTDGVSFGDAPMPLSDTTHVRLMRAAALATGASAAATLTYTPINDGEVILSASVTTAYESDDANNDDEMIVEVAA